MNRALKPLLIMSVTSFLFLSPFFVTAAASGMGSEVALGASPNISIVTPFGSYNWAGYGLNSTKNSVAMVAGSWTQPNLICNTAASSTQFAAFWLGIDGLNSITVEQTGTIAICPRGSSTPIVSAWYEIYPLESVILIPSSKIKVSAGDVMQASVTGNVATHAFTMSIKDATTGKSFSITQTEKAARMSSAEWIAETPSLCNSVGKCHFALLTDFNRISFGVNGKDSATIKGTTKALGSWGSIVDSLTMVEYPKGNVLLATPSTLGIDKSSFTITWRNAGP